MRISVLFLGVFFVLCSCEKKPICIGEETVNKGSIKMSLVPGDCYNVPDFDKVVITDDSTWQAYGMDCDSSELLEVDFDKDMVLAHTLKGKCNLYMERRVSIDSEEKKVNYNILFTECGLCKEEVVDHNIVVVPKVEGEYIYEFDIENNF